MTSFLVGVNLMRKAELYLMKGCKMHRHDKQAEEDKCTKYTTIDALRLVEAAVSAARSNRSVEIVQVEDKYRIEVKVRAY